MTPPILAYRVHSLPPILHMQAQNPMSSYSKGAQGLSVFLRVHGIFTATSISPSLWPSRRLPGLQFGASLALTPPFNLPAPGRRQSVYVVCKTSHRPMFLVNSCPHLFSATLPGLQSKFFTRRSTPYSEVTGLFCRVPWPEFSRAPWIIHPTHLSWFPVRFA